MQHLIFPYINPNMADRASGSIGSCEKYQVTGLGFLTGNNRTLIKDSLSCRAGEVINTGLSIYPTHIAAAVKAGTWGTAAPHIRPSDILCGFLHKCFKAAVSHCNSGRQTVSAFTASRRAVLCLCINPLCVALIFRCNYPI